MTAWLRGVLFQTLAYAGMAVMGIGGAPVVLWSQAWTRAWCRLYCHYVLFLARHICGLKAEVRGPVPHGPCVVAAKHQSMLDVFMIYAAMPQARFIMKRELVRVPVFGLYATRVGCIAVDREAKGAGDKMLEDLSREAGGVGQIVIYPQGTRVAPGRAMRYKKGAIRAYQRFGLPMVLAATNTGVFWPRRGWAVHPGTAVVEFGETLPAGLRASEVGRRMEDGIERESSRLEDAGAKASGLPAIARETT